MTAATPSTRALTMLVVIVNYRTGALVIDCLESLVGEVRATPGLRVTIVDNASDDGSAAQIEAAIAERGWRGWARLIASPVNGGFAQGNNLAIRDALDTASPPPDLFWLLNPDTRVVPGAVTELVTFLGHHPDVGIVGSALIEADGAAWPYAFRFPSILGEVERGARFAPLSRLLAGQSVLRRMPPHPAPADWVSGASLVVRAATVHAVGLLDAAYFLYYEETDFCLQVRRGGWSIWYLPTAAVVHVAGQSTGLTGPRPVVRRTPRYWFDSRRRYFVKNHGRGYAILADLAWLAGHLFWRLRNPRGVAEINEPKVLMRDFLRGSALLAWR